MKYDETKHHTLFIVTWWITMRLDDHVTIFRAVKLNKTKTGEMHRFERGILKNTDYNG